ncbi:LuxR C-terminal-related transcriptional regulator [Gordonia sp. CPCC 205515]|uniref:LuxR C-terminal-related transcriptional regulator n=1 Tax=Gordonia sp. CPCC 205515 TaxID=3140791 RepID=UPI003AF3F4C5
MSTGPLARNVVYRRRLFDRLDEAADVPIVLVSAPAGYGKSLAVASWLDDRGIDDVAWVSLGQTRGPRRSLWTLLLEGVAEIATDRDIENVRVLAQSASSDVAARLRSWILAHPREVVLVLDDLQDCRDAETHGELVEFILSVSENLHVVVVSRHDPPWPLHQLRLDGLLTDIRTDAIRFDSAEVTDLARSLGVELSSDQADLLVTRTQGWAAGLRLALLGMQHAADPQEFVTTLSGRTGYIADYLMREVFDGLPREWQDFLTRVSIVDDVCPELAEALGGGPDSGDILADLAELNAFVYELGHRRRRYRLHPLLLDFLRSRITDRAEQTRLHRLAAEWYGMQGQPMAALGHALDAGDWSRAGGLVGTHVVSWTVCQSPAELARMLDDVPREAVLTHPGLAIGAAAARGMSGRSDGVAELVAAARAQLHRVEGRRRRRYELVLGVIEAGDQRWVGDIVAMRSAFGQLPHDSGALSSVGLADWPALQALILGNLGVSELWSLDSGCARAHLEAAALTDVGHRVLRPVINAQAHLAYLRWECGELSEAAKMARRTVRVVEEAGSPGMVQVTAAYLALAGVALERDDQDAAQAWLVRAEETNREPHTTFAMDLMRARLAFAQGDPVAAATIVQQATTSVDVVPVPDGLQHRAAYLHDSIVKVAGGQPTCAEHEDSLRARLRSHLTLATCVEAEHGRRLEALESALALAAPQELRRPFLDATPVLRPLLTDRIEKGSAHADFAADLMMRTTTTTGAPDPQHGLFESLTEREMGVLAYLAGSLTTAEIADELFISVNTVKTHQRSVYQKLGANSRREAVTRARDLGLM